MFVWFEFCGKMTDRTAEVKTFQPEICFSDEGIFFFFGM
jgi:hypothetical protein